VKLTDTHDRGIIFPIPFHCRPVERNIFAITRHKFKRIISNSVCVYYIVWIWSRGIDPLQASTGRPLSLRVETQDALGPEGNRLNNILELWFIRMGDLISHRHNSGHDTILGNLGLLCLDRFIRWVAWRYSLVRETILHKTVTSLS
jgi:hypothetical protein